jgi:K+-sensing histidine kinase KdpD
VSIYEKKQRWKLLLLLSAFLIGAGSLFYTGRLVKSIAEDERKKIELWAVATKILANPDLSGNDIYFPLKVIENNTQIPVILTDSNGNILAHRNLDSTKLDHPSYLTESLEKMRSENDSIIIDLGNNNYQYLYYRNSKLLTKLAAFPYFQMAVIILFISVSYIAFSISRKSEQNKVWNGLSKETAHQLGTPISSLAGWIEILKQSGTHQTAIEELEKDSERLIKIADRFSKIGSKPDLKNHDIIQLINDSLSYITARQSKMVEFQTVFPAEQIIVPVNEVLLDWVIENLCKNAIDAMEGAGRITIRCSPTEKHVMIDIEDTGKGIPKSKFNTVFKPGFTTKKRGWGLGLSLVKRIIEIYHNGKIYISSSDPGKGTVFRIILNR